MEKGTKGEGKVTHWSLRRGGVLRGELIPCISKILHTFLSVSVDGRNYQQSGKIGKSKRPGSVLLLYQV